MSSPVTSPLSLSPSSSSLASSADQNQNLHRRLLASLSQVPYRRPDTQNLAVLLRREYWKPDREAAKCDTYHCRKPFGIFGRRHHCRKCGGVFCQDCSAQITPLLDTSGLPFIYPPNSGPPERYATPRNPMRPSRVCDDCYESLHGTIPPRQADLRAKSTLIYPPLPLVRSNITDDGASLSSSSSSSSVVSPISTHSRPRPHRRSSCPATPNHHQPSPSVPPLIVEENDPYAGYPLRVPSAICKANGGGRWQPTPQPIRWDFRPPGGKALYEIEIEKSEERKRIRRENPITDDGVFAIRKYRPFKPRRAVAS